MYGWAGVLLRVDLSNGTIEKEPLEENLRLNYIGGRGINSRILFDEVGPEIDPLSPENRLIFASSPLSGTSAPCVARFTVTAKSPLTGILGDGNAGGRFGPAIKRAGIDHIVIHGKASEPVYLWIDNGKAELKSARHLWGKNIREAESIIKEDLGDRRIRVAAIGQAGENLVKIASIIHEERSASRTGVGAVMGSKNLKAVAIRGSKKVNLFNPDGFRQLAKELQQKISTSKAYDNFRKYAGIAGVALTDKAGILAVKNFCSAGEFEGIENFNAQKVADRFYVGSTPCYGCPIGCGNKFEVKDGPYAGEWGNKIEEGAYSPLGPVCGNDNIDSIFKMNNMGNQFGIDLIEFGQAMAVVMECYEKGIVSEKDLDGISMTWGNYEAMMQMMEKIAFRQGVGDILSDGIVQAAKKFGKEAERYVSHSKGMVMTGIEPRIIKGTALGFATSTRGADHLRGLVPVEFPWFSRTKPEEAESQFGTTEVLDPLSYNKAGAAVFYQHHFLFTDLFEICRFSVRAGSKDFSFDDVFKLYSLATGVEIDESEMLTIAERVYNVERAFICREGIRRRDDRLIGKWADEPVPNGPYKGEMIDSEKWEVMLDEYYRLRGWDENGVPKKEKLKELGLDDVADALEQKGVYS
jgi:aldehyde:ferredoxin oxidoreductase